MSSILYRCRLDRLKTGDVTWRCGKCLRGELGPIPGIGDKCPECGAVVKEAPMEEGPFRRNLLNGVPMWVLVEDGLV